MFLGFTPLSQYSYPVHLGPGGTTYPRAGNYIVNLGRVSVLQWMDWNSGIWRNVAGPGTRSFLFDTDGSNYRIVNLSGVVTGAAITNAGTTATNGIGATATGVAVTFGSAPTAGRAATAYPIVGGAINTTITITTAGTGLLVPPLLVFDPPPAGGVQAAAYCTLTGTGIGAVTVTNAGAGYTSVPNCYVIPQWGQYPGANIAGVTAPSAVAGLYGGAQNTTPLITPQAQGAVVGAWTTAPVLTVNATLAGSATLTAIVMLDYGSNYLSSSIPTITITGAGAAAATAIMSLSVTSITVADGGGAVSVAPTWQTALGSAAAGLLAATDDNNNFYQPIPAKGTTTAAAGAVATGVVEDPGFGLQAIPEVGVIPAGGTIWTSIPNLTAVLGGIADTSILQPSRP